MKKIVIRCLSLIILLIGIVGFSETIYGIDGTESQPRGGFGTPKQVEPIHSTPEILRTKLADVLTSGET